jgi:hypothetical protein
MAAVKKMSMRATSDLLAGTQKDVAQTHQEKAPEKEHRNP